MKKLFVQGISKTYGNIKALDHVELAINPGELMVIMGPSGCGKTTLLLVILGALKPDEGHVWINGNNVDKLPLEERNIGYLPQDFGLFPHLTVYDNIAFGLRVRKYSKETTQKRVDELLLTVDLEGLENRKPNELSGGQKQRVALARALAINPSVLLLDEPLSNIDEATKSEVRVNLKEIQRKSRVTTLCVTHNPEDAFQLGDRIAIMYSGKIIQQDTPEGILKSPENELVRKLIAPMYILWNNKV
ncbi:MAG: ABC transporter ATP-binding protein [Candidatus Bathyarchaeia archaeon]